MTSRICFPLQGHIILGLGDLKAGPHIPFEHRGVMSCSGGSRISERVVPKNVGMLCAPKILRGHAHFQAKTTPTSGG